MSNPPFVSPLYDEEEDFSFPIEAPNDPINTNPNPLDIQQISPNSLPSSSVPMTDYQDLSMFLDYEEDFDSLIGQFPTIQGITDEWVREIEQGDDHDLDDQEQQGAQQGSSDGHGSDQHRPIDHHDHHQAGEGLSMKKLDHNAKERVRRLKLNASYLAFRSLLPESKKAKEKWSAPYIIDRALDYIPQLQAEIDKLTLEKANMLSVIEKQQQQQGPTIDGNQDVPKEQTLTVSINEVKRGEMIIQICQKKNKLDHELSALIEKLEGEGIHVLGSSSLLVSEDRSCFHLHVQQGSPDDHEHGIQQRLIDQGDHDHQTADGGVGQGSSIINKLEHRARERVRRMKLSASYLALRTLLPDSKRAYCKRWTAPYILDRTLDYIPRLQAEIGRLTLEKNKFLSLIGKRQQQQQQRALASDRDKQAVNKLKQTLNVSINEVKRGELIVQICQQKGKLDHIFSALIKKLEGEDIEIIGASSICISEDTSCFHLHVQVCQNPLEADYVADLQKKLIYWLS